MLDLLYFGTSVSVTQDQTRIPPARGRVGTTVTLGYRVQMVFTVGYYQKNPTISETTNH